MRPRKCWSGSPRSAWLDGWSRRDERRRRERRTKRDDPMPAIRRSPLALIAGTVLATLAVQRHLSRLTSMPDDDRQVLARNVWHIPAHSWKDILAQTWKRIGEDRLLATAAGVVFYGLLAIFPAITALVSSYALFADPHTIAGNLESLALMLPEGSFAIIQDQIGRVLAKQAATLGTTFI